MEAGDGFWRSVLGVVLLGPVLLLCLLLMVPVTLWGVWDAR
jgi:hypothetical protein